MTDRPILFSAPMVRALLDGRKTQTRRLLKPKKHACLISEGWTDDYVLDPGNREWLESYYRCRVGGRLWVRESWRAGKSLDEASPTKITTMCREANWKRPWCPIKYEADEATDNADTLSSFGGAWGKSRVSIHMPRWASRLTLTVTDVRVQRLQDIGDEDCIAEGIESVPDNYGNGPAYRDYGLPATADTAEWYARPIDSYRSLWVEINGAASWVDRPWVVAVSFRTAQHNIDQVSRLTVSCTEDGSMRA